MADITLWRDHERARIARWFGDTDLGPVFFTRDRALRIAPDERALWLDRADRLLDDHVAHWRWMPFETVALALILLTGVSLGLGIAADYAPVLAGVPPWPAVLVAGGWPRLRWLAYVQRKYALRRHIARQLGHRGPVPAAIATPARRHNLFHAVNALLSLGVVALVGNALIRGDVTEAIPPILAIVAIAWPIHLAARRVDTVHSRRVDNGI